MLDNRCVCTPEKEIIGSWLSSAQYALWSSESCNLKRPLLVGVRLSPILTGGRWRAPRITTLTLTMWYYAIDGEKHGPVAKDDIQRMIDDGDIGLDDLVWSRGMEDWKPASQVECIHPDPPPLPDEEKSPSPPSISEEKHGRLAKQPRPKPKTGGPISPSQEGGAASDRDESSVGTAKSTERIGIKTVGVAYADFWSRLVAYAIDLLIATVVSVALSAIAFSVGPSAVAELLTQSIGLLVTWFYFAGFESSELQATPGKQMMGLKVTDVNMGYDRIGFRKATGRHFGKIISGAILLLGFIMAAFTEKHQALHDRMAGCLVVEDS